MKNIYNTQKNWNNIWNLSYESGELTVRKKLKEKKLWKIYKKSVLESLYSQEMLKKSKIKKVNVLLLILSMFITLMLERMDFMNISQYIYNIILLVLFITIYIYLYNVPTQEKLWFQNENKFREYKEKRKVFFKENNLDTNILKKLD